MKTLILEGEDNIEYEDLDADADGFYEGNDGLDDSLDDEEEDFDDELEEDPEEERAAKLDEFIAQEAYENEGVMEDESGEGGMEEDDSEGDL